MTAYQPEALQAVDANATIVLGEYLEASNQTYYPSKYK